MGQANLGYSTNRRFFVEDVSAYNRAQEKLRMNIPLLTLDGRRLSSRPTLTESTFRSRFGTGSSQAHSHGKSPRPSEGAAMHSARMARASTTPSARGTPSKVPAHASPQALRSPRLPSGFSTPNQQRSQYHHLAHTGDRESRVCHSGYASHGAETDRRARTPMNRFNIVKSTPFALRMQELKISDKPSASVATSKPINPPWRPSYRTKRLFSYTPAQDLKCLLKSYDKPSAQAPKHRL